MKDAFIPPRIVEQRGPARGQVMTLIKCPQRQQSGVAGDLAAGRVRVGRLTTVEGEGQLWYNILYHAMDAPKGSTGWANPVFMHLLEHPFFFQPANHE
jgi:hypothetical protein